MLLKATTAAKNDFMYFIFISVNRFNGFNNGFNNFHDMFW